ncbi:uncharacterized protein LOC131596900 [Vicia villosa]|uniref:uncharacterized protein LOC131596900 n=1 Tax=Vicia villosa TaxID=3911 RepID=UPI00273BD902|nr:uncharacterized protein LOC131596900 [Vicia villosa]
MKKFYAVITVNDLQVPWRFLFHGNMARPRAIHVTWLACHGNLATKDKLCRFNMIQDSRCNLCKTVDESLGHLFFECPHTLIIWKKVLTWLEIVHTPGSWLEKLHWVINFNSRKGWRASILKLAFTKTVYGIWAYRNDVIFQHNTNRNIYDSIIDCIVYRGWSSKKIRKHIVSLMV